VKIILTIGTIYEWSARGQKVVQVPPFQKVIDQELSRQFMIYFKVIISERAKQNKRERAR
jgi:hypothetical protein